jgi:hypothetical protein
MVETILIGDDSDVPKVVEEDQGSKFESFRSIDMLELIPKGARAASRELESGIFEDAPDES